MIREIIKDKEILQQKSVPFIFGEDDYLIKDMLDTANAHEGNCAGLACIQIGINKKIIVVRENNKFNVYINPSIIKRSNKTYVVEEGCLSIDGTSIVKRHQSIKLIWTTTNGKNKSREFTGITAQIIQHECDHLNGVLI